MALSVKELQIGDWVMLDRNYPALSKSPVKITWYDLDRIRYGRECVPILLTAEILEKNGFKKGGMGTWWHESEFYLTHLYHNDCFIPFRLERMHIRHVHELQHALRLCGLNELADNFQI